MIYYVIRHKQTRQVLPVARSRNKTSAELSATQSPRLFTRQSSATQALDWWCGGIWHMELYASAPDSEPDCYLECEAQWRTKDDMEIIRVLLIEQEA